MNKNFFLITILVLIFSGMVFSQTSSNWYVNKNATGLNSGTSWENAWPSFSSINWSIIESGDILLISGGTGSTIYNESLVIGKANVTVSRSNEIGHNGKVYVDGNNNLANGISIIGFENVTIDGLDSSKFCILNFTNNSIRIRGASHNTALKNLQIIGRDQGANIFVQYNGVSMGINGFSMDKVRLIQPYNHTIGQMDGVQIDGVSGAYIKDCYFQVRGHLTEQHTDIFQAYRCEDFYFDRCEMYHYPILLSGTSNKQGLYLEDIRGDVHIKNCYIYMHTLSTGSLLSIENWNGIMDKNIKILNNTLVTFPSGSPANVIRLGNETGLLNPGTALIQNNIFVGSGNHWFDDRYFLLPSDCDYNIYYEYGESVQIWDQLTSSSGSTRTWAYWTGTLGWDAHSYTTNPSLNNYIPSSSSDAHDKGIDLSSQGFNYDLKGVLRPQNNFWDIGAYEILESSTDITPPRLLSAIINNSNSVTLNFSEFLNQTSAQDINNYNISNGIIIQSLLSSSHQVFLTTSSHSNGDYLVTVNNVTDLAGNQIDPSFNSYNYSYTSVDTLHPQLISAAIIDSVTLNLFFSENLDLGSAQNIVNYTINNVSILSAVLNSSTVTLSTSAHTSGTYSVFVNNVMDLAGNLIDPAHNLALYEFQNGTGTSFTRLPITRAIASVTPEPEHYAEKTIDGNGYLQGDPDSRWAGDTMPEWLLYDLSDIQVLNKTRLSFYKWNEGRTYNYSVEVSVDSVNWTQVLTNVSSTIEEWSEKTIDPIDARYIKIIFISSNQLNWASLWEAEFWGHLKIPTNSEDEITKPVTFSLEQNYPNPFNPTTTIKFSLPTDSNIKLVVYNMLGEEISTLANGFYETGTYEFNFNAAGLASGVYVYRLESKDLVENKKMLYLR